jgi:hypothetical protein
VLVSVGGNDRRFVPILLSCVMDDNGGQPVYETDLDVTRGKKQVIQGIPPVTPCNPGYLSNPKVWQQAGGPTSLAHPRGTPLPAIPASATAAIDAAFRDTLTRTYAALRAQYPCAQIFVNNYPELLPDRASDFGLANSDWPEFLHGITQDELDMLNVMWLRTNAVIDAAVKAAGPGFHLVDMNADRQFKAHNVASSDPWGKDGLAALQDLPVSWVTPGPWASAAPFHPNSMGQHQMAIRDVGDIAAVMALGPTATCQTRHRRATAVQRHRPRRRPARPVTAGCSPTRRATEPPASRAVQCRCCAMIRATPSAIPSRPARRRRRRRPRHHHHRRRPRRRHSVRSSTSTDPRC